MEYNCAMYVSQIRQMTIRALNQILKKHNITLFNAEQSKILEFLWQEDNLTPKDISKHTGLAISSLTSIISLTDLGKSLKKDFDKAVEEIKSYTFKNFKQEEIILFEYYLKRVFENLENLL